MNVARRLIIYLLVGLCWILDHLPRRCPVAGQRRWYLFGDWGCSLGLGAKSDELDQRWGTGVWREVNE